MEQKDRASNRARLPRSRRVTLAERPPMQLMERDRDIIKAVNDCRALLGSQIQALFFNSRSTAQYRLSRLYQHEFLDRQFMSVTSGGPASSPIIYTLGKRGAQVLIDELGYEQNEVRLPKRAAFAWQFLEHLLKINDVRVAVTLATNTHGWELEAWYDEAVFRGNPDYVMLKSDKGKMSKKPVLPDGYFCLNTPWGKAHFFLEVDRGKEPHSKFRPQVEVYQAYTASGQYQTRFSKRSLRVLVVTTSPRRMANLKETTLKAGGDRKYWFTTFEQLTPDTVFTVPIWQRLDDETLQPLIILNGE